jgi:GAF domain-containing protein
VVYRKIPDDCRVRELRWRAWRALDDIREIRALRRPNVANLATMARTANLLARATDAGEALLFGLHAAVDLTGASVGLLYRFEQAGPIVRYARGPAVGLLGLRVPAYDAALVAACRGQMVFGSVQAPAEHAICQRLTGSLRPLGGVAMVPLIHGARLLGAIELGHFARAFRSSDAIELARLAAVVSEHYVSA